MKAVLLDLPALLLFLQRCSADNSGGVKERSKKIESITKIMLFVIIIIIIIQFILCLKYAYTSRHITIAGHSLYTK